MASSENSLRELLINTTNNQQSTSNTTLQQLIDGNSQNNQEESKLIDELEQEIPQILESLANQGTTSVEKKVPIIPIAHAFKPIAKNLSPLSQPIFQYPQNIQPLPVPVNSSSSHPLSNQGQEMQFLFGYPGGTPSRYLILRNPSILPGLKKGLPNQTSINLSMDNPLQNNRFSSVNTLVHMKEPTGSAKIRFNSENNRVTTTQVDNYWMNVVASHFQNNSLILHLKSPMDLENFSRYLHQNYEAQLFNHLLEKEPIEIKMGDKKENIFLKLDFRPELAIQSGEEAINCLKFALKSTNTVIKSDTPIYEILKPVGISRNNIVTLKRISREKLEDIEESTFSDNCLKLYLRDAKLLRGYSVQLRKAYEHLTNLLVKKPFENRRGRRYIELNFKPECLLETKEEAIYALKKALYVALQEKELKLKSPTKTARVAESIATPISVGHDVASNKNSRSPLISQSLFRVIPRGSTQNMSTTEQQVYSVNGKRKREGDERPSEEIPAKRMKIDIPNNLQTLNRWMK